MVASSTSADKTSPFEQFTGRKFDAKIDLRIAFGDYVQAISPKRDNHVENANTHGCVAVRQTGSLTGSLEMWRITTRTCIRDERSIHYTAHARRGHQAAGQNCREGWYHSGVSLIR